MGSPGGEASWDRKKSPQKKRQKNGKKNGNFFLKQNFSLFFTTNLELFLQVLQRYRDVRYNPQGWWAKKENLAP